MPDEVKVNIKDLLTVNGSSARSFVNLNPVNKGVEHGVGQFGAVLVFLDKGDKSSCLGFLDFIVLDLAFQFLNTPFKEDLFLVVLLYHPLSLSLRQSAFHRAFIEVLYQLIKLCHSLYSLFKLLLSHIRMLGFVIVPDCFELGNKLSFVFKDIFADCLDGVQNSGFQYRCFYKVRYALIAFTAIVAALKSGI